MQPVKPIILYKMTNLVNEKIYIGQTINLKNRLDMHKSSAKHNKPYYICSAIRKYGWNNFHTDIIAMCRTISDANETEIFLIKQYNSQNPNIGYNLEAGGSNSPVSDITKEKLQKKSYKRKVKKEIFYR